MPPARYNLAFDRVSPYLAVKPDFALVPHDDRHPLPDVVEVQDTEQLMHLLHTQSLG